jgi:hypothetical protein
MFTHFCHVMVDLTKLFIKDLKWRIWELINLKEIKCPFKTTDSFEIFTT